MKIFLLAVAILFIGYIPARAQWTKVADSIGLAFARNDTLIGSVWGWNQGGAISTNGGKTWEDRVIFANNASHQLGSFAVDPSDPNIWYVSTDSNGGGWQIGLYKTTDAGTTWTLQEDSLERIFDGRLSPWLTVSWSNPSVLYSVEGGHSLHDQYHVYLKRSDDGGNTWNVIDDVAGDYSTYPSISFAQDMKDSNTIYWYLTVTINESVFEQFFVSHDKGETASELYPPGKGGDGGELYTNPSVAGDIYFFTDGSLSSQLWHSSNYGATWDTATSAAIAVLEKNVNRNNARMTDFIVSKNNPDLQFAALDTGVIVKYPDSADWTYTPGGNSLFGLANPAVVYDDITNTLYFGAQNGLWKWEMPTDVREPAQGIPNNFALGQNYPNPFHSSTTFRFQIPQSGAATLKIYNMLGECVATLASGEYAPGVYTAQWDAKNMPSGVYYSYLRSGGDVRTQTIILSE